MTPILAIIADDVTGLQAIAGEFARVGFRVRTVLSTDEIGPLSDVDIVGIDTNSRALSREDAVEAVTAAAEMVQRLGIRRVYKQSDSGMQGHIAPEAQAIADHLESCAIVYCPSCPGLGRITRAARQISTGSLPDQARLDVHIPTLWRTQTGELPQSVRVQDLASARLIDTLVVDAESDRDLLHLAKICLASSDQASPLLVGSVGFANATALWLRFSMAVHPALVVAGSLQAQTLEQLAVLQEILGSDLVPLPTDAYDEAGIRDATALAVASLAAGRHCILASPHAGSRQADAAYPYLAADALRSFNATMVAVLKGVLARGSASPAGIVVAGGMTSELVAREVLNVRATTIDQWIAAGTTAAIAICADGRRFPLVTKAGTWGDADTLLRSLLWIQTTYAHMQRSKANGA